MLPDEAILQEASQLHGFVESIIRICTDLRDDYPVFAPASLRFFDYVVKLGKSTQGYLEIFPSFYRKSDDDRIARSKLQKLYSLKTGWEALHAYVKPSLDADSLHLPSALITAFEDIVNGVEDWASYKFVLFHATEANYLQIPSGMAREVANDIAISVGCDPFDPNLGLVGIPYSQTDSIYLNCVLPHEFAHFLYQEYCIADVEDQIDSDASKLSYLDSDDLSLCLGEIKSWVEETFCDLMAVCMIGPAFSLSLARLISANALADRPDGEPGDSYSFKDGYPADVARLHFHRKLLETCGWWHLIDTWHCPSVEVLAKCATWSNFLVVEGAFSTSVKTSDLMEVYSATCQWLIPYCSSYFPEIASQVSDFQIQLPEITKYLERAIVPSTIWVGESVVHPTPVTLLNAGLYFLLEKLPDLISQIAGQNASSVETRSRIGARVELWILKAIEDNRLLARQEPE